MMENSQKWCWISTKLFIRLLGFREHGLFYALVTNIFGALIALAAYLVPVPMGFTLWQRQFFLGWEIHLSRGGSKKQNIKNSTKIKKTYLSEYECVSMLTNRCIGTLHINISILVYSLNECSGLFFLLRLWRTNYIYMKRYNFWLCWKEYGVGNGLRDIDPDMKMQRIQWCATEWLRFPPTHCSLCIEDVLEPSTVVSNHRENSYTPCTQFPCSSFFGCHLIRPMT